MAVIEVGLSDLWIEDCEDFAVRVVKAYRERRGRGREESLSLSWGGAEENTDIWCEARMGELACCGYLNLKPELHLEWGEDVGRAWDLVYESYLIDVKNTHTRYLFWPVNKTRIFDQKNFTVLVSTTATRGNNVVVLNGWMAKKDFRRDRLIAGVGHDLAEGTRYVPFEVLLPMTQLRGW